MPGTNLTRDEAATRAALLDVTSYTVDLDLTTGDETFGSTTTIRFTCREPGAEHLRRPGRRDGPRDHAQRPRARPRDGVRRQPDRADRPRRRQRARRARRLHLPPHRRGPAPLRRPRRRPGLPLLASSRSPTPAGSSPPSSSPTSRAVFTFNVTAPGPLEGRLQRADARADAGSATAPARVAVPAHQADVDLHHRGRRRRVPRGARHLRGRARHDPAGPLLPPVAGRAPRPRGAGEAHQAGLRVLRGGLRLPVPVREVRPALRAGVQHGRDGERRLRDPARRVPPPQPPGRARSTSSAPR